MGVAWITESGQHIGRLARYEEAEGRLSNALRSQEGAGDVAQRFVTLLEVALFPLSTYSNLVIPWMLHSNQRDCQSVFLRHDPC